MIVFTGLIHSLDLWALHGLYSIRTYGTTLFFIDISELGAILTIIGMTAAAVLLLMTRGHHLRALGLIATMSITGAVVSGLKYLVARPRPDEFFQAYPEVWYSFPSWHAAGTAALAGFLVLQVFTLLPRLQRRVCQGLAIALSAIIGFSRIYLGVHYLSDVVAGWIIGAAIAYGVSLLTDRFLHARP